MNNIDITEEIRYSRSAADRAIVKIIRNNSDAKDKVTELTTLYNKIASVDKNKYVSELDLVANLIAVFSR